MSLSFDTTEKNYTKIDFSKLKDKIIKTGREVILPVGMVFRPKESEILIVISGQMTVSNSGHDGLLLGHTFQYMPIGLIERYYQLDLYYQVEKEITLIQLTTDEFDEIFFTNPQNAAQLSQILTYMSSALIHIYYERNNDSGYATIRQMLHRYIFKAEQGTLNNEGIASFILKRTRLSRSYVFQILSGLKAGGYITIKNAKLVSINKEIPRRF
ncbi:helix-turn-helix domain-containing protein [Klebsiella aerogenes]|uniref:helix-turn-helix domain-containing protein n=1 Tax=Klebsiella aerogenes TaxID=548 RepID=UPI002E3213B2|nr:helix-turn-helix domain-containing protein [Klebsiella aerogenes]MED7793090.1 helix-turn-helix domain-containing protein [Klebsiella aerogenes]